MKPECSCACVRWKGGTYLLFELRQQALVLHDDGLVLQKEAVDEDFFVEEEFVVDFIAALLLVVDDALHLEEQDFGRVDDPVLLFGCHGRLLHEVLLDRALVLRLPAGVEVLIVEVQENGAKQEVLLRYLLNVVLIFVADRLSLDPEEIVLDLLLRQRDVNDLLLPGGGKQQLLVLVLLQLFPLLLA